MRPARSLRPWVALGLAGVLFVACSSTDAGVETGRATEATPSTETEPTSSADTDSSAPQESPTTDTESPTTDTESPTTDTESPTTDTGSALPPISSTSGESGVGDSLFPDLGNPGIDVDHYDIDITYDHETAEIVGTVVLTITATAELETFTLDSVGLDVSDVEVDSANADFEVDDPELRITPGKPIAADTSFEVRVAYTAIGNSMSVSAGETAGWFETEGGSFVLNEPDGARRWLPSNDHPTDKATYRFTVHVPEGVTAAANGELVDHETTSAGDTWIWQQDDPMTTYLIQLMTGELEVVDGASPGGVPLTSVIQSGESRLMQPYITETGLQIDWFEQYFGPYPFERYGIAMTDGYIGGAMEEQGRSLFSRDDFASGELDRFTQLLLSHELTHQWFGDAVSPGDWQDIWLNESFATYGEWMWLEHTGYGTITQFATEALANRQRGSTSTGRPSVGGLFGYEVYDGGAVVLQALRDEVGDDLFFEILRTWVQDNRFESRTSADFIELSSSLAGQDLTGFFDEWLYATDLPDDFPS